MDIRLSSYAFELLISFVYDARFMLVIKVINFRVNIKIYEQVWTIVVEASPVATHRASDSHRPHAVYHT